MRGEVAGVVAALPLPALVIRADERIEAANDGALALLGQEIAGRHYLTALRQPALLDAIEPCLKGGAARHAAFHGHDGQQDTRFRVSVGPVRLESGPGVLLCFEDETSLAQTVQMRRDFVANVSHELRTPLTALIGFVETLRGPARDDPEAQARFLDIMEAEAQRMNRLVGDLLSLSRVEAEERVRPKTLVDMAALLCSVRQGLTGMAEKAGVQLATSLPGGEVQVTGDADQLRQVLSNLVENGIKYGGRGATVTMALSVPAPEPRLRRDGVRLTVADTGPGIDPIHLPRLTERFYRVDSGRSREMGGTGLGLAIVKHIVNRHRGRLRVDSAPGQGTRVTVVLPLS